MADRNKERPTGTKAEATVQPRNWPQTALLAAIAVGLTLAVSATVNPLLGRSIHWDWVAGIAPVSFGALVYIFRRRWV